MDYNEVLTNLKEKGISEYKSALNFIEKFQNGKNKLEKVVFEKCLRYICNHLKAAKSLEADECSQTISLISKCCENLLKDDDCQDTVVQRALYHIIFNLIRMNEHEPALKIANHLHDNLQSAITHFQHNAQEMKNLSTVVNSSYLAFWNSAVKFKVNKYTQQQLPLLALKLRLQAILFLMLDTSSDSSAHDKITSKITTATQAYMYTSSQQKSTAVHSDLDTFFSRLVPPLYQWINKQVTQNPENLSKCLGVIISCVQDHIKYLNRSDALLSEWAGVLKIWFDVSSLEHDDKTALKSAVNMLQSFGNLEKAKQASFCSFADVLKGENFGSTIVDVMSVCLSVMFVKIAGRTVQYFNMPQKSLKIVAGISQYFDATFDWLSKWSDKFSNDQQVHGVLESFKLDCFGVVVNMYRAVLKQDDKSTCSELAEPIKLTLNKYGTFIHSIEINAQNNAYLTQIANELTRIGVTYYQLESYASALPLFSQSCSLKRSLINHSSDASSLVKTYDLLAYCQRKSGDLMSSLKTLVVCMVFAPQSMPSCFERWMKVKYDAAVSSNHIIQTTTIRKVILDNGIQTYDVVALLEAELDVMKKQKYDTSDECFAIVSDLFEEVAENSLSEAKAYLELAQLLYKKTYQVDCSATESCQKAVEILTGLSKGKGKEETQLALYYLAMSYFWLYLIQLQQSQDHAQREVEENKVIPLEKMQENQSPSQRDGDHDENDTCDVTPAYSSICIHSQSKLVNKSLQYALNILWQLFTSSHATFIQQLTKCEHVIFTECVSAMAEIYATIKKLCDEIKCWSLMRMLSIKLEVKSDEVYATSRLIRCLCECANYDQAKALLNHLNEMQDVDSDQLSHFSFLLAKADLHFHIGQFEESCKNLKQIMAHPIMEQQTKQAYVLQTDAYILMAHFFHLHPDLTGQKKTFENAEDMLPIYLCTKAVDISVWLVKVIKQNSDDNITAKEPIGLRHRIVNLLIDSCLEVGKMYILVGAIREARCFLKEGLSVAHKLALAHRAAEALMAMVETDLLCEKTDDCNVKLSGIRYILCHISSENKPTPSSSNDNSQSDNEDFLVTKPGRKTTIPLIMRDRTEVNAMASPEFQRQNVKSRHNLPDFISHRNDCKCEYCTHFSLYELVSQYLCLQAECMHIEGSYADSRTMFAKVDQLCQNFKSRIAKRKSVQFFGASGQVEEAFWKRDSTILVLKNGLRTVDLLHNLGEYQNALRLLQKMIGLARGMTMHDKATNWIIRAELKYQACIISLEMIAAEKRCPVWKLYDSKWKMLLPDFADKPAVKHKVDDFSQFKTPVRKKPVETRVKVRAPVKKLSSLCIHEDEDQLNTAMLNLSVNDSINQSQAAVDVEEPVKPKAQSRAKKTVIEAPRKLRTRRPPIEKARGVNLDVEMKSVETPRKRQTRRVQIEKVRSEDFHVKARFSPDNRFEMKNELKMPLLSQKKTPVLSEDIKPYSLEEINKGLLKAMKMIEHSPPLPLYNQLSTLLAICSGNDPKDCHNASTYFSQSACTTLRHIAIYTILRKLKKQKNKQTNDGDDCVDDRLSILHFSSPNDNLMQQIPQEWTIVQIDTFNRSKKLELRNSSKPVELFVTRYSNNFKPQTVRINISSASHNDPFGFDDASPNLLSEFQSILEGNAASMRSTNKKQWWTQRIQLDNRMKSLADGLENVWLKHWKGLLLGSPVHPDDQKRLQQATLTAHKALDKLSIRVDLQLLQTVIDSVPWLSAEQLNDAVSSLTELQATQQLFRDACDIIKQSAKNANSLLFQRNLIVLILGKDVQCLPWESAPIIKEQPVARMPSLQFVASHVSLMKANANNVYNQGINSQQTFYVLNPATDLDFTQQFFHEAFKQAGWTGTSGRIPSSEEFSSGLREHDLFIYCGHGCGGAYLAGEYIRKLDCRAAALLIGCSSGRLKCLGSRLEPVGMVWQYLLSGCPSVMGNLWDVTDRDIDTFLNDLLLRWLPSFKNSSSDSKQQKYMKNSSLTQIMQSARSACKLKSIIGSAPVVYGLPVFCSL